MFHHLKSPNARAAGFCRAQPLLSRELSSAGSYRLICQPSSALSRTAPSFHPSLCSSLEQACWKGKRRLNIHRGPTGAARDPRKLRERRGRHTPQHLWAHFSVDLGSPYTNTHTQTQRHLLPASLQRGEPGKALPAAPPEREQGFSQGILPAPGGAGLGLRVMYTAQQPRSGWGLVPSISPCTADSRASADSKVS